MSEWRFRKQNGVRSPETAGFEFAKHNSKQIKNLLRLSLVVNTIV